MNIKFHASFKKAYKSRISPNKKIASQVEKRISLFKIDPKDPILRDHQLTGAKRELRAFSITGDLRIVYIPESDQTVTFVNIGSHNQVY